MRSLLFALALALLASPAAALQAPKDYAGKYTLSGVSEGAAVCKLTLTDEMAIGGWGVSLAKDCYGKFGLSQDIAAWTVLQNGSIAFIDPLRKVLLRFEPTEIGGYVAERPGAEPIALDRDVKPRTLTERERMSGNWVLTGLGGKVICRYAMTSNKAATAGSLKAQAGCPKAWARVTRWETAKGRIRLVTDAGKAGKLLLALPGDSIQGFTGEDAKGVFYGFSRDG
ncbi:hypothetical protein QO010_003285 [Caulobacter ginsengisoli]|uniref:Alkaline proteinase inhibitor/ Outer membrane lipoprotein Omp19 domain-containing protein n=1 Tax=Caulobacter ginsengisoli TaxID=400775 RepID=A0ABU0IVX6_9CAUL|nr:AprI/Inh family metalloprotease inhibitor [Caulobacter ginsengisoli]MDQ0465496.1 hypothetical protein [Caulobacter ginsengisoli]